MNSKFKSQLKTQPITNQSIKKSYIESCEVNSKGQILRLKALEKNKLLQTLWHMDQSQMCHEFLNYQLFPYCTYTMAQLLNAENLKLIHNHDKIYFGQVSSKKRNGNGILVEKSGKIYEGQFVANEKRGFGIEFYSNGNIYVGRFSGNKKHGQGLFFWFNLNHPDKTHRKKYYEYFEGDWWGGLPDGNGIHQKVNGDNYSGKFKNGLKHGKGSQRFANGDYYEGEYINGLPEGYGEYQWKDGSTYKGDMKQGQRNGYGFWKMSASLRQNYKGHYVLDKKEGYGEYLWENGWLYKGDFKNDLRDGYGQLYHQSVLIWKGDWEKGEKRVRSLQVIHQTGGNSRRGSKCITRSLQTGFRRRITQPDSRFKVKKAASAKPKKLKTQQSSSRKLIPYYKQNRLFSMHKCQKKQCGCNQRSTASSLKKSSRFKRDSSQKSLVWKYKY